LEREVERYYNKGVTALDDGNWLLALQHFRKCHELDPRFMPAYHEIADIYQYNGHTDAAVEELKGALLIEPEDVESLYSLGIIYTAQDRHTDAIRVFKRIEIIDPDFGPELYYNIGMEYKELGSPDQALDNFKAALEMDPSYFECLEAMGSIHLEAGRLDDARKSLTELIDIDPAHVAARRMLAVIYSRQGQWKMAVDQLENIVTLSPEADEPLRELGAALRMAGEYERSVTTLKKALEMNPENIQARINLGEAFISIRNFEDAIRELEKAGRQDPGNPVIKNYLLDARNTKSQMESKGKD
jgi:tetratricopeptide (TPR) repeat protein